MKTAVQLARYFRQNTIAITAAAALLGALGSGEARADTASAEALFRDAKALMAQGRYTEACPKLAASQKLDPSGGTILHLALCHREEGRIATAYRELEEAVKFAQRDNREDREKAATALMAELAPKVPKLTILVSQEAMRIAGIEVKRDGALVPASEWGSPAWMDPGSHTVAAWAPGRKPFLTTVDLRADGNSAELSIPDLEADLTGKKPGDAAGSKTMAGSSEERDAGGASMWTGQRKAALIVGGIGVAAIGVGTVFGLQAAGAKSDSDAHCTGNICDDEGIRIRQDGIRAGNISTATFIVGGAAVVGGIVLFATGAPKQPKKSAGVTGVTVGPAWASVRGQW